jgi:LmbE family N-acetylglucosaminyl deacetylase
VTHVFVSPHPDDVALSCGGLVSQLTGRDESIVIVTVFCGAGSSPSLTEYQRDALGFGAGPSPGADRAPAVATTAAVTDATAVADAAAVAANGAAPSPRAAMAERRREDERYADSVGARIVFLNLPDAVFRGYEGDDPLFGRPRADDPAPIDALARELARLQPGHVYFPLAVGNHVDHQLVREAGVALLGGPHDKASGAVGVGPGLLGRLLFYEDFPYAQRIGFERLDQLPGDALAAMPHDVSLAPEYADLDDLIERKIAGIRVYSSQVDGLFGSDAAMVEAVKSRATRVGQLGGMGPAERYWRAISS